MPCSLLAFAVLPKCSGPDMELIPRLQRPPVCSLTSSLQVQTELCCGVRVPFPRMVGTLEDVRESGEEG